MGEAMRRGSGTGGKPPKAARPKTAALRRRHAAKAAPAVGPAAGEEPEIARLRRELNEALERQTATADLLKVISRSSFDLQAVFDTMVEAAGRLARADRVGLRLLRDGLYHHAATYGFDAKQRDYMNKNPVPAKPGRGSMVGRVLMQGKVVHIEDAKADPEFTITNVRYGFADVGTALGVPLSRGGELIGLLILSRRVAEPFTARQIELVTAFAAQAVIAIENTRLLNELRQRTDDLSESLEQQTATADVLRVISSSPGDLTPVFDSILANATRICGASFGNLELNENGTFRIGAMYNAPPAFAEARRRDPLIRPHPTTALARVVATKKLLQIEDTRQHPAYKERIPTYVHLVEGAGARTLLIVPLLKEDELLGVLGIYRQEVCPFTDKQIALVENFAAQAVIAIENTRLLNELRQSLEQQTATADVLRVISSSPGDLEPVFQSMLANAVRICEATAGNIYRWDGQELRLMTAHNTPAAFVELLKRTPQRATTDNVVGRMLATKSLIHTADASALPVYLQRSEPLTVAAVELGGVRTLLVVPMFRDDELVGAFTLYRSEVRPFTDKQIELVQNFAAQAVIAIENTRLLSELRESLEQQTATSDVLSVISRSPGDLEPVFQSMLANAVRICEAMFGTLFRFDGARFHLSAHVGTPPELVEFQRRRGPFQPEAGGLLHRVMRTKQVNHTADNAAEPVPGAVTTLGGARSLVVVPMLKDDVLVGTIHIYRQEVRPFTDKQIALVENFAAQAVIAIENTRLLNELRQRTDDLTESLEQQTATSEVLSVISSSPGELEPVFQAMLENAVRICGAKFGNLILREGEGLRIGATYGAPQAYVDFLRSGNAFADLNPEVGVTRLLRTKQRYQVVDVAAMPTRGDKLREATINLAGARTLIGVPMLKGDEAIGAIIIYRQEVRPFTDKQIELLTNFAAQAVIAIENTRLLNELRESLEQQTATSEVLKVISSSPGDLQPVFQAMLESATRICEAGRGTLYLREGDGFRVAAFHNMTAAYAEARQSETVLRPPAGTPLGDVAGTKQVAHYPDLRTAQTYIDRNPFIVAAIELGNSRTAVCVPMLKDGELIGAITIARTEVRPFTDKQIALLQNFAAQAVIAIENTRLLNELRASLEQQTATADVLRVISSSPGELQPVFDAMLDNAVRICEAKFGVMFRFDGDEYDSVAMHNLPASVDELLRKLGPRKPTPGSDLDLVWRSKQPVHTADMLASPAPTRIAKLAGTRTQLAVPMLRDDELIGAISIFRTEVRPFTDKQIALVQNFAAQAVIAIENTRLLNELRQRTDDLSESLEQQTATSEVLKVISSSPGDLEPVFNAMLENAVRICEAKFGVLNLHENGVLRMGAMHNVPPAFANYLQNSGAAYDTRPGSVLDTVIRTKQVGHTADRAAEPVAGVSATLGGARSLVCVPMLKDDEVVGAISVYRQVVQPFTDKQIALVQNFAAQAVIAIENTRLLSELRESLEQQTATAEVLRVISSSPGELQPVFEAMLENASRICEANFGVMQLCEDDGFRAVAMHNAPPAYAEWRERAPVIRPGPLAAPARVAATKRQLHIADMKEDVGYKNGDPATVRFVELADARTAIFIPMLREDEVIGTIAVYRQEVRPFTEKQIALLTNFAAQAVIAIENTRLLNELRQSLEQQTATAEILSSISGSVTDTGPVFETILRNLLRLFESRFALVLLVRDGWLEVAGIRGESGFEKMAENYPLPLSDKTLAGKAIMAGRVLQLVPVAGNPEAPPETEQFARDFGFNALISVPLIRQGEVVGALSTAHRDPKPFTDGQVELLTNFAAQAVIAIENTRLLNELRQRTDDLSESLEQQTATSEVLKVISSSPGDLEPVFNAMLENAVRICEAKFGVLNLHENGVLRMGAMHNVPPAFANYLQNSGAAYDTRPGSVLDTVIRTKQVGHTADRAAEPVAGVSATLGGARSLVCVPMLKDDEVVGAISVYRQVVQPFTDKQIALVQNFAAQAVIAIENTRLLNELRQRTDDLTESLEQQTATSEVLQVISSSPGELEPVFNAMLENAVRICEAEFGTLFRFEGATYRAVATHNSPPELAASYREGPRRPTPGGIFDRMMRTRQVCHTADYTAEGVLGAAAKLGRARSIVIVPMIKDDELIGAFSIYRQEVRPFTDKQIALVQNFAAQAVIAIENTRLLNELRQRTGDLTESLEQQTATSEILASISGSMTDTKPVFDAILRNLRRLFGTRFNVVNLLQDGMIQLAALDAEPGFGRIAERYPLPLDDNTFPGRAILGKKVVQLAPVIGSPDAPGTSAQIAQDFGFNQIIFAPMMRGDKVIGAIGTARREPKAFDKKQVALMESFAAQAVIAIENVRLFNELRQRTDDLTESLQQQTATADVLKVISRSTFDLQTVLDTLTEFGGPPVPGRQGRHLPARRGGVSHCCDRRLLAAGQAICGRPPDNARAGHDGRPRRVERQGPADSGRAGG